MPILALSAPPLRHPPRHRVLQLRVLLAAAERIARPAPRRACARRATRGRVCLRASSTTRRPCAACGPGSSAATRTATPSCPRRATPSAPRPARSNLISKSGDRILVIADEFPSNVLPWRRTAQETGASLVTVPTPADGDWTNAILLGIEPRVKVVAMSTCHWTNGARIDLEPIAAACRANGSTARDRRDSDPGRDALLHRDHPARLPRRRLLQMAARPVWRRTALRLGALAQRPAAGGELARPRQRRGLHLAVGLLGQVHAGSPSFRRGRERLTEHAPGRDRRARADRDVGRREHRVIALDGQLQDLRASRTARLPVAERRSTGARTCSALSCLPRTAAIWWPNSSGDTSTSASAATPSASRRICGWTTTTSRACWGRWTS